MNAALALIGVLTVFLASQIPVGGSFEYIRSVPQVYSGGRIGSGSYVNGHVRTAAHVAVSARAYVNSQPASVLCREESTDSAVIEIEVTGAHALEETFSPLRHFERVTIAGWPQRQYYEGEASVAWMLRYIDMKDPVTEEYIRVGPVYVLLGFTGDGRGMSGGPVIRADGKVAATVVGFGDVWVFAVPVGAAACQLKAKTGG